jgi:hypothetical protein
MSEPIQLVMIEGSLNEHMIAMDMVESGKALVAKVHHGDFVSFEAYRLSPTSTTYAWRSSAMSVPAFMPMKIKQVVEE